MHGAEKQCLCRAGATPPWKDATEVRQIVVG